MRDGLLVIERMVLESLSKKKRNIEELERDTGLDSGLLRNTLSYLLMKNLIQYSRGIYTLNKSEIIKKMKDLNGCDQVKEEIKELFASIVNSYYKKTDDSSIDLKVKKIWLTPSEEKIFNSYLINLETFIINIEKERKKKPVEEKLREKKVVIWGTSDYSTVASGCLKAI